VPMSMSSWPSPGLPSFGVSIEVAAVLLLDGGATPGRLRFDRGGLSWEPVDRPAPRVVLPFGAIRKVGLVGGGVALEVEGPAARWRFAGDGVRRIHAALRDAEVPEAA
jgi:hypothetical protein